MTLYHGRLPFGRHRGVTESPFSEEALNKLREEWFILLGGNPLLREKTAHQPFFLFALAATLEQMGDEDTAALTQTPGDNYVTGRKVGVGEPIAPTPLVFRPRRKMRKYDESEFLPIADNYPSAEEAKEIILRQFQEEEKLGWMYPLSESEAKRRFGQRLRVASLAAIPKDEQTVRVLFDGTHSVQVNNEISISDRLEFPCPSELAQVMEHCQQQSYGVVLSIAADIMKAHRRFLHCEEDHGLLGCKADSTSSTVWINRVGTFGVACAALHFGRLAGAIFRMVIRVLQQQPCFQLLFAVASLNVACFKSGIWVTTNFLTKMASFPMKIFLSLSKLLPLHSGAHLPGEFNPPPSAL